MATKKLFESAEDVLQAIEKACELTNEEASDEELQAISDEIETDWPCLANILYTYARTSASKRLVK